MQVIHNTLYCPFQRLKVLIVYRLVRLESILEAILAVLSDMMRRMLSHQ